MSYHDDVNLLVIVRKMNMMDEMARRYGTLRVAWVGIIHQVQQFSLSYAEVSAAPDVSPIPLPRFQLLQHFSIM